MLDPALMEELTEYSARQLAEMIRRRAASPVEVVEAHLRRIERLNPRLNAIVTLAPDALVRAREAEAALMRAGKGSVGALHGVPLTVKDTIETAGLRTTFGTLLRADYIPERDAAAVSRLRAAGAIILGKTNASELALDYTADNPVFGRTNNPLDEALTPGGSSGGCAAAVCAHLAAASLGSDMVGSIRVPAHFCGVAGLKPTAGSVPSTGHFPPVEGPYALAAALGPLARRVEDLALLYGVLSGPDSKTPRGDQTETGGAAVAGGLRGLRAAWYTDDGVAAVSDDTRRAVESAARALGDAGLNVSEGRPPHVERGAQLWLELFSYPTQRLVRTAYAGREAEAGAAARLLLARGARDAAPSADAYFEVWAERDRLRAELLEWMKDVPLLVAPVGATAAYAHDTRRLTVGRVELGTFRAFSYAQTFNTFDLPAACVPSGKTLEGLPVGVQIVGRPFAEQTVLAAARVVEAALSGQPYAPEILSNDDGNPL